jgi:hypothetical protein
VVIALGVAALATTVFHAVRPSPRMMVVGIICIAVTVAAGLLGTTLGLRATYATIAHANPSERQARLAEGISQAMNCTAFALAALILWIPPFVIGVYRGRHAAAIDEAARTPDA